MLNFHTLTSAGAAASYFKDADAGYYLGDRDIAPEWTGQLREHFHLGKEVDHDQFARLLANKSLTEPRKQITSSPRKDRDPGRDLTFSAPKSLSIAALVGGDDRIVAAHHRAVMATLAMAEAEVNTRVRKGKVHEERNTGNWLVAVFTHLTGRPMRTAVPVTHFHDPAPVPGTTWRMQPDPQLHEHAVVPNLTMDGTENEIKAIHFQELKRNAGFYEAAYHSLLAGEMQQLGYEVRRTKHAFELVGISEAAITQFSRRKEEVEKKAAELGIKNPESKAKLGATTRLPKEKATTKWEFLVADWRNRLQPDDLAAVDRTVQAAREGGPIAREEGERAAVDFALAHLLERKSAVPERHVATEALRFGIGSVTPEGVAAELAGRDLVRNGSGMVSTQEVLGEEERIVAWAKEGRGKCVRLRAEASASVLRPDGSVTPALASLRDSVPAAAAASDTATTASYGRAKNEGGRSPLQHAERFFPVKRREGSVLSQLSPRNIPESTHRPLPHVNDSQSQLHPASPHGRSCSEDEKSVAALLGSVNQDVGHHLSPSQTAAVRHVLTSRDRLILVRGAAGVGKTTMLHALTSQLSTPWGVFATQTSASRGVLRDDGFKDANTLAFLLKDKPTQDRLRNGLIIIDEASQTGAREMAQVVKLADQLNARILLLGDRRQHKSVARGDILALLEREAKLPVVEVSDIKRQAGEYKEAVKLLADGKTGAAFHKLDKMGWVKEIPVVASSGFHLSGAHGEANDRGQSGGCYGTLLDDYIAALKKNESVLVVSPTNANAEVLTDQIRERLRQEGKLKGEERTFQRLVPLNLTEAERGNPEAIPAGSVAQFVRSGGGFKAGRRVKVGPDTEQAVAGARGSQVALFRDERIRLATGDAIRVTATCKDSTGLHRLDNGTQLTVTGFSDKGIHVKTATNLNRILPADVGHIAHAYVSTSHAAQGKTVQRVFVHMPAATLPAVTSETAYVSVSRGKLSATIYTDSKSDLLKQWGREDNRLLAHDLLRRKRFAQRMRAFVGRMVEAARFRDPEHTHERSYQHER